MFVTQVHRAPALLLGSKKKGKLPSQELNLPKLQIHFSRAFWLNKEKKEKIAKKKFTSVNPDPLDDAKLTYVHTREVILI